jgi:type II secretion system protein H
MPRSTDNHHIRRMSSPKRARGFTLIELMVVVILIGILAFMAMPTMNAAAIDRHVYEDAANIQDVIREAHARALGRGGAVLVKLSTKDSNGSFQTYEIRSDIDGGQNLPLTGCKAPTSWVDDATLNMVQNAEMNFSYEQNNNIKATIYGPDGVAVDEAYLCFASAGRTFYSKTRIFDGETVMAGAIRVQVARYKSGSTETIGIVRNVLVPPSGAARVVSGGG